MDSQMVELAGMHWLTSQLLRADLEVALPERDRGIDLIVYADLDEQMGDFVACPIPMKASMGRGFTLEPKYEKFRRLLLVYVWNLDDPAQTAAYAMTYAEALSIADAMGFTRTESWLTGGKAQRRGHGAVIRCVRWAPRVNTAREAPLNTRLRLRKAKAKGRAQKKRAMPISMKLSRLIQ